MVGLCVTFPFDSSSTAGLTGKSWLTFASSFIKDCDSSLYFFLLSLSQ